MAEELQRTSSRWEQIRGQAAEEDGEDLPLVTHGPEDQVSVRGCDMEIVCREVSLARRHTERDAMCGVPGFDGQGGGGSGAWSAHDLRDQRLGEPRSLRGEFGERAGEASGGGAGVLRAGIGADRHPEVIVSVREEP